MGLAKQTAIKTYTTCGTPDYFAPEIIDSKKGQTEAVDWWTVGVLIHELMSGHTPFESSTQQGIFQKVMRGTAAMTFPYGAHDPEAMDIVRQLLKVNPSERLTMRPGLVKNLKNHPWYLKAGFDWQAHYLGQNQIPYAPVVKDQTDMSNFSAKESELPKQLPYVDPGTGWDRDFATPPNT